MARLAHYSWHPLWVKANRNMDKPFYQGLSDLFEQVKAYWENEQPNTILTDEEAYGLAQIEARCLEHAHKYHTCQDNRGTYRQKHRLGYDPAELERLYPYVEHTIHIGASDAKFMRNLAKKMPHELGKRIGVSDDTEGHIDIWITVIAEIREHCKRRYLFQKPKTA